MLTPDQPLASVVRTARVAAGTAATVGHAPLARAGRVHQPRAGARLRREARSAQAVAAADRRRRARPARPGPFDYRASPSAGSGQASGAGGRLTIDATPRAPGTPWRRTAIASTIKFDADALDLARPIRRRSSAAQGLIQAVRVADAATLAVDLGPRFGGVQGDERAGRTRRSRLVIDVAAQTPESTPSAQQPAAPRRRCPTSDPLLPADRTSRRSARSPSIRVTAATTRARRARGARRKRT